MYDVAPGRMDEFVDVFRKVVTARRKFGFSVESAWIADGEDQFVWIARYDGPGTLEEASRRYYESDERKAVSPDPASFLTHVETRLIRPLD